MAGGGEGDGQAVHLLLLILLLGTGIVIRVIKVLLLPEISTFQYDKHKTETSTHLEHETPGMQGRNLQMKEILVCWPASGPDPNLMLRLFLNIGTEPWMRAVEPHLVLCEDTVHASTVLVAPQVASLSVMEATPSWVRVAAGTDTAISFLSSLHFFSITTSISSAAA